MPAKPKKSKKPTPAPRVIEKAKYKSFRLSKRIRQHKSLPPARKIFSAAITHLWAHKKLYLGITALYVILTVLLVKGLGFGLDSELNEIKDILNDSVGDGSSLLTGAALFGFLIGNAGSAPSEVAGIYQSILLVIFSLVIIWALRQTAAQQKPRLKDTFYKGMYPLIPFLLTLGVIVLQLLPLAIGNFIYNIVISNGLAVNALEQIVWALLFGFLALLSFYMLTSSLFALYIVTLPDVTPLQALRSARELVRHRRLHIGLKLAFLPLCMLVLAIVLMLPIILYATALAEAVFFVLSTTAILVTHAYVYELYRKLL